MKESIASKGPLSILKYKWIAKAFTKDIAGDISMKTNNWLDEIIYNPPELNLDTLKNTVLFVIGDSDIKSNLDKVQNLIRKSPGNKGGAEIIINYYENRT